MRLGLRDQEAKVADYLMAKINEKEKEGGMITGEKTTGGDRRCRRECKIVVMSEL